MITPASRRPLLALLALAALLGGCNSNSPVAPGPAERAVLTLTVIPSPIPPDVIPGGFQIRYTIKIAETAGVGGTFEFVNSTLYDDATGAQVQVNNFDDRDMVVFVGTKRLEPNTSLDVPQQIAYATPGGASAARLAVAVRFKDDKDNTLNDSVLVRVN